MKWLLKFILKLILIVLIIVVVVVGGLWIAISDSTDEAPVEKYVATDTIDSVLATELGASLNEMGANYELNLLFNEDSLNKLLFAVAKNINEEYNPGAEDATNNQKYIKAIEIPSNIPVVGGKALGVKNLYGKVNAETEEITLNVTGDVANFIKTRIWFTFKVEDLAEKYVLKINAFKVGKIGLTNSLARKIADSVGLTGIVNDLLKDLPFEFAIVDDGYVLNCPKDDFNEWIKGVLNKDDEGTSKEESKDDMKSQFVNLLLDPNRNMIKLGMFDGKFGVKIDLNCLKVDESKTTVDESVKEGFDTNKFIETQSKALILNGIYSTGDKFLSISESDMTKLIYQNMLKDGEIAFSTELMAGVNFNFKLEGISFDIDDEAKHLNINIIMNINGLKTTAVLVGDIEQTEVVNDEVKINLKKNKLQLGNDIEMDSSFLTDILSANFASSDIMKFENGSLVFNKAVFDTMMTTAVGDGPQPLKVKGLGFVKDNLRIYVEYTDAQLAQQISNVTDSLKGALEDGITLDISKFSPEEAEKVAEVQEKLTEISNKDISEITAEDTDALMATVGEMSSEAQEEFFSSITESIDPAELQSLYDLMFASGAGE